MHSEFYDGYVICDLDGCLSDDRWRRELLPKTVVDASSYDAYHELCGEDEMVVSTFESLINDVWGKDGQNAMVLFVTARPDRQDFRAVTIDWIDENIPGLDYVLLMRPSDSTLPSPSIKLQMLNEYFAAVHGNAIGGWAAVVSAYDDRLDVLKAYPVEEHRRILISLTDQVPTRSSVPDILTDMATTFKERNAVYADNYLRVAPIISILWPDGVPSALVTEDRWHLFELMIVKLTRFAISDLTHIDSIHDAAVYAAMVESDLRRNA